MSANATPFISVEAAAIRLGDQIVFEGLNWRIRSNEHWAVVGPNGSGKSALMKALCGRLPIVKGKIVYHFADGGGLAARDRIAFVNFDSPRAALGEESYYQARWNAGDSGEAMTVDEYLSIERPGEANPYRVDAAPVMAGHAGRRQAIVERLELSKLLDRKVNQLSNGERRRASIARAWLCDPRLVILDSPFVGLDERYRSGLAEHLENLMQGETRVIITGTNREEIPPSFTHVMSVRNSRAIAQGPRQAFHGGPTEPANPVPPAVAPGRPEGQAVSGAVLVDLKNVCVSYNGTPILRQITWQVRENERWALVGPNGAGKTTLLSLILADNPQAYANDVTLFGRRRGSGESIWEIKRRIGWVAPELQLYYPREAPCLDVVCSGWHDSVGLHRRCKAEERESAHHWLCRLGISDRSEAAFGRLSEGEQRLVLLARALVKDPSLLVLDEPCQNLDDVNRDKVLHAVEWVSGRPGTSMIYVTHRADELPNHLTHLLKIDEGRIVDPLPPKG